MSRDQLSRNCQLVHSFLENAGEPLSRATLDERVGLAP